MYVHESLPSEISATASLTEMEQQIQVAGKPPMREALKPAIRQREEQTPCCPHCGQKQRRLEGTVRRTRATTFGCVEVARRRFRGLGCWRSFCPANHPFTELKGGTISHPLREAARLSGCSWPYRVASGRLEAAEWSPHQCGRDPEARQPGRSAASRAKAGRRQSGHAPLTPSRLQQHSLI